jgi:hypothetical protein
MLSIVFGHNPQALGQAHRPMVHDKGSRASSGTVRLAAGTTVVEFTRDGDRWRHRIATADGRRWESVEGEADHACDPCWPASPVLTEVTLTETAGRPAILGLGLAGRSHFSLCVTIHAGQPDTLLFEAACRLTTMVGWLGSTYRGPEDKAIVLEPCGTPSAPPATVQWSYSAGLGGPKLRLSPSAAPAAGG